MNANSEYDFLTVRNLVRQMWKLIALKRSEAIEQMRGLDSERRQYPPEAEEKSPLDSQLALILSEIDEVLTESGYNHYVSDDIAHEFAEGGPWRLGTQIYLHPPRKIRHGTLIPVQEIPINVEVSLRLFAFLTIQGDKDKLARDVVQSGIHYHYVLAKGMRTTTMICWDTRWKPDNTKKGSEIQLRPIFHELHGKGRYTKDARPHRWGEKKRKSIYDACLPDLQTREIQDFRCASNNANSVWLINARVTT